MDKMLLSKRNRIYYLWYTDPTSGTKRKVSTGCTKKVDALKFLRTFHIPDPQKQNTEIERCNSEQPKYLSEFIEELYKQLEVTMSPRTLDVYRRSLTPFAKIVGNIPLREIQAHHFDLYKMRRMKGDVPSLVENQSCAERHHLVEKEHGDAYPEENNVSKSSTSERSHRHDKDKSTE